MEAVGLLQPPWRRRTAQGSEAQLAWRGIPAEKEDESLRNKNGVQGRGMRVSHGGRRLSRWMEEAMGGDASRGGGERIGRRQMQGAAGVAEFQRVTGGADEEEEENHEHQADLAAAVAALSPAPARDPTTAATFGPHPPPPRHHEQHLVGTGEKTMTEGEDAANHHRNYNVAAEVALLKRFELYLESWEQILKDREDALNRREREAAAAARAAGTGDP